MKENILRVFENRMLSRLYGHKRDEAMIDWRKLHNERHHLYFLPNNFTMIYLKLDKDTDIQYETYNGPSRKENIS
jgi:hypothetical protein